MNDDVDTMPAPGEGDLMDDLDRQILLALRGASERLDPPPLGLSERIQFAMTLRALDAEIAELQELTPTAVRGQRHVVADTITFASPSVELMIRISVQPPTIEEDAHEEGGLGDRLTVQGWVSKGDLRVDLWSGGRRRTAIADPDGRLTFTDLPRGRAHFIVHPPEGAQGEPTVVTPVIEL